MILKTSLAIESLAGTIAAFNLKMEGLRAQFTASCQHKLHSFCAYAALALFGLDKEGSAAQLVETFSRKKEQLRPHWLKTAPV